MHIKWLGHASFLIISSDKKKIITDPYHSAPDLKYSPINESADIVTKSHNHGDHNNTGAIKGNPVVLDKPGTQTVKGIQFIAIPAFHDETEGSQRGKDLIFCIQIDSLNVCHLGDLGHLLDQSQLSEIGLVDVLLIPVGGYFTIEMPEIEETIRAINPRLILPMHYKTSKVELPITTIDVFLEGKKNIRKVNASEIEINKDTLPVEAEIVVLQPAN